MNSWHFDTRVSEKLLFQWKYMEVWNTLATPEPIGNASTPGAKSINPTNSKLHAGFVESCKNFQLLAAYARQQKAQDLGLPFDWPPKIIGQVDVRLLKIPSCGW